MEGSRKRPAFRLGGWRDWGPGLLTSRDFCELVEGWHSLQFVRVHLGCLSLQIPGFNLLPGPWHATVEDTAKSDNYREDRAGLARARAQTPRNDTQIPGLSPSIYVGLTQESLFRRFHLLTKPLWALRFPKYLLLPGLALGGRPALIRALCLV